MLIWSRALPDLGSNAGVTMNAISRFAAVIAVSAMASLTALNPTAAQADDAQASEVLRTWYRMVLELVRHTPTYSPPVASRSFAYLGVTAFETVAAGSGELRTFAGQLNGLSALPPREAGEEYNDAVALQAAMASATRNFFGNTGPTGQRAMAALDARLSEKVSAGLPADVVARSEAYGEAVAAHVLAWSAGDGGAVVENMGFPLDYKLTAGPAHWTPTNLIAQQQTPLLPDWGQNRTFAMPDGAACPLPPPPAYSEDKGSEFYREALEVYEVKKNLTPEQRAIARFWSDDPMLSPTPPGHWISIAMQILDRDEASLTESADIFARLGVAMADSFIGCWHSKYEYDLLRPVTYIRRLIDPTWEALLITPPFPEYPSGHSTQSAAAATVLTDFFGEGFAFTDATHEDEGLATRSYPSFWAAAAEAGISRLYGGIHFRAAIGHGLDQGRCIGAFVNALSTRN
jgi:hypothetical protein